MGGLLCSWVRGNLWPRPWRASRRSQGGEAFHRRVARREAMSLDQDSRGMGRARAGATQLAESSDRRLLWRSELLSAASPVEPPGPPDRWRSQALAAIGAPRCFQWPSGDFGLGLPPGSSARRA